MVASHAAQRAGISLRMKETTIPILTRGWQTLRSDIQKFEKNQAVAGPNIKHTAILRGCYAAHGLCVDVRFRYVTDVEGVWLKLRFSSLPHVVP